MALKTSFGTICLHVNLVEHVLSSNDFIGGSVFIYLIQEMAPIFHYWHVHFLHAKFSIFLV